MKLNEINLYCIDLGSRAGMPQNWVKFKDDLFIDAFDPDVEAEDKGYKKENNVKWYASGLSGKSGKAKFYITNVPSGSSLYNPNAINLSKYTPNRYWKVKEIKDLEFLSFSDFLEKNKKPAPDLVKLDTQGSELDILQSLKKKQLSDILGIEVEVEFLELYKNQPLFRDIDNYLSLNGFELMDLRTHRSYRCAEEIRGYYLRKHFKLSSFPENFSAKLIAGDAFYIKKLDNNVSKDKSKVLKIIKILLIYNFIDEALALVYESFERGLLSKNEKIDYINEIIFFSPEFSKIYKKESIFRKFLVLLKMFKINLAINKNEENFKGWSKRVWPNQ